jgi:hypothetical protein
MIDQVFGTALKLDLRTVAMDRRQVRRMPGMAVTVEIENGSRRAIA